jgi:hypothetical protein
MGGWVGLGASLDDLEKRKYLTLSRLELRLLGRPARSQSLYRLRHPGSHVPEDSILKEYCQIFNILHIKRNEAYLK